MENFHVTLALLRAGYPMPGWRRLPRPTSM
jgi:hypothetical protein